MLRSSPCFYKRQTFQRSGAFRFYHNVWRGNIYDLAKWPKKSIICGKEQHCAAGCTPPEYRNAIQMNSGSSGFLYHFYSTEAGAWREQALSDVIWLWFPRGDDLYSFVNVLFLNYNSSIDFLLFHLCTTMLIYSVIYCRCEKKKRKKKSLISLLKFNLFFWLSYWQSILS